MNIFGDYHTHTNYSHGKGSVLDNALAAKERRLFEFAVTDHGFGHLLYGLDRKRLDVLKSDAEDAYKRTGCRVLVGIEANLNGLDGEIDLSEEEEKEFELVIVGFHKAVKPAHAKDFFGLFCNSYRQKLFAPSKAMIRRNTQAVVRAIDRRRIDILSHINFGLEVDVLEVGKAAAAVGTLIELNGKRINISEHQLEALLESGANFVLDSDAHTANKVGDVSLPLEFATRYGIDESRLTNLHERPSFRRG